MNMLRSAQDSLTRLARTQRSRYAGDADRPLGGYLLTMTTYTAVVAALAGADLLQFTHAWLQQESS